MTKNNSKYPRGKLVVTIIQIIVLVFQLFIAYYTLIIHSENLEIIRSSRRADLSILANKPLWSMTNETFTLNVSGEIRNEGSRKTRVDTIEIGATYILEHGFEQSFVRIFNASSELGWENSTFIEEQSRNFVLTIDVEYTWYRIDIGKKPDRGWIRIKHYDGIAVQEQTSTFPIE